MKVQTQQELIALTEKYVMKTYGRYPIVMDHGKGSRVWDLEGKEYVDFLAGLAVNGLGHCHPNVVQAIQAQAQKLLHVSNLYHMETQTELARLLVENSFADKAFFCNSGAEAVEAAMKLARKFAKDKGDAERFEIITMKQSFHGRTLAAVTATGQEKFHKGFEPLVPGFHYAAFNNLSAVEEMITNKTCAVMLEPVQGEGGVNPADKDYLKSLRTLCDEKGALLIFDEVQCGMGRTGKLFAYEHYGVVPDIMTLAKALGGGVPIGAMVATDDVAKSFTPGTHAATFGGNPLSCAAGLAVMTAILAPGFLERVLTVGNYFYERLEKLKKNHPVIREVRGLGLMLGIELTIDGTALANACLQKGFLINCTMGNVLRFLPPLVIEEEEIDLLMDTLDEILKSLAK